VSALQDRTTSLDAADDTTGMCDPAVRAMSELPEVR